LLRNKLRNLLRNFFIQLNRQRQTLSEVDCLQLDFFGNLLVLK